MLFYHDSKVLRDSFEDYVYVREYQRHSAKWKDISTYGWYRHICTSRSTLNLFSCFEKKDVTKKFNIPTDVRAGIRNIVKDPWHIALVHALEAHAYDGIRYKDELYINSDFLQVVDVVRIPFRAYGDY